MVGSSPREAQEALYFNLGPGDGRPTVHSSSQTFTTLGLTDSLGDDMSLTVGKEYGKQGEIT